VEELAVQWGLRIFVGEKLAGLKNLTSRRKELLFAACRCRYDDEE